MKNKFLLAIFVISNITLFAQEVKLSTDKGEYKFDEIIKLIIEINAKPDSMELPEFKGLKIISGPNKSSSFSFVNGEQSVLEVITLSLSPTESGKISIESPIYFVDGAKVEGQSLKITVDASKLNAQDLEEKLYVEFIEDAIKPQGTTRVVCNGDKGYIEIFDDLGWVFHRRLTPEEIEKINSLK